MTVPSLAQLQWYFRWLTRRAGPSGVAALATFAVAMLLFVSVAPTSRSRLAGLEQQTISWKGRLARAAGSFDDANRTPEEQLSGFYDSLPALSAAPDLLERIYRSAAQRGLALSQGEYRARHERSSPLLRYQITLPVSGPYLSIREFLADVLREVPFAALDNVSFQRGRIGETVAEARVHLTIYMAERP